MSKEDISGYKKKFNEDVTSFNDYEATDYVKTLKQSGDLDEAIEVGSTFYSMCPHLRGYINQYGYALYNKYINKQPEEIKENEFLFFSFAKDILNMCKQEKYSPYEATVYRMIRYITSKDEIDYKDYEEKLRLLDPKLLSNEPLFSRDGKIENESPLERWYRQMVKVLYEQKRYKECITYANNALASIHKFHRRNLQNIQYMRALSSIALEDYDNGQRDLLALQGQMRYVNLYETLYKIYASKNEDHLANAYLLYDLYQSGYDTSKKELFQHLLDASTKANYTTLSDLVTLFIQKVEIEEGIRTQIDNDPHPNEDSGIIYDRMMEELTNHLDKLVEREQGKVTYYNQEKLLGNIRTPQDTSIFFRQADYIYDEEVERHDEVSYTVLPSYDRKKDTLTKRAVLILLEYND